MRLVCIWCSKQYKDTGKSVTRLALHGVCPECDKRVKKVNKKYKRDKKHKRW